MSVIRANAATVAPTDNGHTPRKLVVRQSNMIDDAGTIYLWLRRIVMGALVVIFSRPGRGKSTLGVMLAAHVTNGWVWPDGTLCPRGSVLYIKGEGTDASIKERAEQAGVDESRFFIIGRASDDENAMIDLANDTHLVAEVLDDHPNVKLIIIDTLDSLFSSMRMIDNANIRRCLDAIQRLAEERGVAVVIMAHTNKGAHADPLDRLSGGRAIGGAARALWYLGKLDHESDDCYMAAVKCNDFVPNDTIGYRIVGDGLDKPGRIEWTRAYPDVSSWDLDGPPTKASNEDKGEACRLWLATLLADGPLPVADVNEQATAEGYGGKVYPRAKKALGCKTIAQQGTRPPVYWLCLPGQCPTPYLTPEVVRSDSDPESNVTTPEPVAKGKSEG